MSDRVSLTVRMADKSRSNPIELPANLTIADVLQGAQQKWNLPSKTDYAARLERTGKQLDNSATLDSVGIKPDDVLEIYPILEAG